MAQVRRATDTVLGRDVAVKIFRDDLDDESAARARTEMQTLASLTHPHLVAVHDAGTFEHGQPFLVMELVEGPTLAARCVDGPLDPAEVSTIGAELADALAYVHGRGVVHRDVKPANVLISPSGAKLADFGIARIVDSVGHTSTGLTVGTAPYLSPEQVTGEPVGPPADVYALGLLLLECLTGRREFTGSSVETALARLHRSPVIPATLDAPWPGLLHAMTARQASERPTAAAVAETLRGGVLSLHEPATVAQSYAATPGTDAPGTEVLGFPTRVLRLPTRVPTTSDSQPVRRPRRLGRVAWILGGAVVVALIAVSMSASQPRVSPPPASTPLEQHINDLQKAVTR